MPCDVPQSLDSVHIIWGIQTALWPNKASLTKDHFSKGDKTASASMTEVLTGSRYVSVRQNIISASITKGQRETGEGALEVQISEGMIACRKKEEVPTQWFLLGPLTIVCAAN